MKLIVEDTEEAMSESALHILLGAMMQDKRVNISLTSGESPKPLYKMLAPLVRDKPQFEDVHYYLFDEAPHPDRPYGPNWDMMHEMFFDAAGVPADRIHDTMPDNWETYDWEIREAGGLDVMLVGLGFDGHFCSNCPRCTPLDSYTYAQARAERNAANPGYPDRPGYPTVYTMGPKSLMRVRHLVMIVNGKHKAAILKRMLDEPISNEIPATVLKLHPNFTVICDRDAASELDLEAYPRHRI